jgi:hypothetical protein
LDLFVRFNRSRPQIAIRVRFDLAPLPVITISGDIHTRIHRIPLVFFRNAIAIVVFFFFCIDKLRFLFAKLFRFRTIFSRLHHFNLGPFVAFDYVLFAPFSHDLVNFSHIFCSFRSSSSFSAPSSAFLLRSVDAKLKTQFISK